MRLRAEQEAIVGCEKKRIIAQFTTGSISAL